MSVDDLKLEEKNNLYPPRFVITVTVTDTAENSPVVFTFQGATEEIVKEFSLTKGIVHMICRLLGRFIIVAKPFNFANEHFRLSCSLFTMLHIQDKYTEHSLVIICMQTLLHDLCAWGSFNLTSYFSYLKN